MSTYSSSFPNSTKIYETHVAELTPGGPAATLRVPMREVSLAGGNAPVLNTGMALTLNGNISATSSNVYQSSSIAGALDLGGATRTIAVDAVTVGGQSVAPLSSGLSINAGIRSSISQVARPARSAER